MPAVVHVRYAVDPCRPWQGVSPLAWAETAATLLAGAETALSRDMQRGERLCDPAAADAGGGRR